MRWFVPRTVRHDSDDAGMSEHDREPDPLTDEEAETDPKLDGMYGLPAGSLDADAEDKHGADDKPEGEDA